MNALLRIGFVSYCLLLPVGCNTGIDHGHRSTQRATPNYDSLITVARIALQADTASPHLHLNLGTAIVEKLRAERHRYMGFFRGFPLDETPMPMDSIGEAVYHLETGCGSSGEEGTAFYKLAQAHSLQYFFAASPIENDTASVSSILHILEQSLASEGDSSKVYGMMASCYERLGKHDLSHWAIAEALRRKPANGSFHRMLGQIQFSRGHDYDGYASLHKAVTIGFEDPGDYLEMALFYASPDEDLNMVASFHKSIQIIPSFAKGFFDLGFRYFRKDRRTIGVELCDKAIALDSAFVQAIVLKGIYQSQRNEIDKAVSLIVHALDVDSLNATRIIQQASREVNFSDVPALLRSVLEARPNDERALPLLGWAFWAYGPPDSAIRTYATLSLRDPTSGDPYYHIGDAYFRKGDTVNAIVAFTQAMKLKISNPDLYWDIGNSFEKVRMLEQAVEAEEKYLASVTEGPYWDSWIIADLKKRGCPVKTMNAAAANFGLGLKCVWQFENTRDPYYYTHAVELFSNATRLFPEFTAAYSGLGHVYEMRGDSINAARSYKRAAILDNKHGEGKPVKD